MRRDKRPFVVELKRGQKRPLTPVDGTAKEPKQGSRLRAQEALFGGSQTLDAPDVLERQSGFPAGFPAGFPESPSSPAQAQPPRRILEALAPVVHVEPEIEMPRRGRKPGSKNKLKSETPEIVASSPKRPRGRPPRNPEGRVRTVAATPELEKAALQSISRTRFNPPVSPIPGGRMSHPIPMFEPPPKRKRGRPRKVRPPKFDWTVWTSDEAPEPVPTPQVVQQVVQQVVRMEPVEQTDFEELDTLPVEPSFARFESTGPRLRAGERWKRRIRVPGGGPARPRSQDG